MLNKKERGEDPGKELQCLGEDVRVARKQAARPTVQLASSPCLPTLLAHLASPPC